ncbi:MAG: hypothetical protein ACRDCG_02995 [Mycoplasmoidaceae bacterium]
MKKNKLIRISSLVFLPFIMFSSIILINFNKNNFKTKVIFNNKTKAIFNNKIKNLQNNPTFVYVISTVNPNIIFSNGVHPFGQNMDLEAHVTGGNNYLRILQGDLPDDGFISTSPYFRTVLQQLSILQEHHTASSVYIYRIRASNFMYSLNRTASQVIGLLDQNRIPGALVNTDRYWTLRSVFWSVQDIASEDDEWFATRQIEPNIIQQAQRVDLTNYDQEGLPIVDPTIIRNNNYVDAQPNPNPNPYFAYGMIPELPENIRAVLINFGQGLARRTNMFSFNSRPDDNKNYDYIPIPTDKLVLIDENKIKNLKDYLDKPISQNFPLNVLGYELNGYLNFEGAYPTFGQDKNVQWTYDQEGRIGYKNPNDNFLFYCLTALRSKDDWDYVVFKPALDGDDSQQWDLKLSEDKKTVKIISRLKPNYKLAYNDTYLVLRNDKSWYKEIGIIYNKLQNKDILFKKSYVESGLKWFNFRWNYNGVTYFPTLSGSSSSSNPDQEILYYEKFKYILYIKPLSGEMWALKDQKTASEDWNWIEWNKIDNNEFKNLPTNPFKMWNVKKTTVAYSSVEITNFISNDPLWVQIYSTNWGSYFTSKSTGDYWSLATKRHISDYLPS